VTKQRQVEESRQIHAWTLALSHLAASSSFDFDSIMKASGAVVLLNPDYYQAWNARKRAIISNMTLLNLEEEMKFNVECIKANPKSYYAWYHRRWLLALFFPRNSRDSENERGQEFDPKGELHLCQILLNLDTRNCMN